MSEIETNVVQNAEQNIDQPEPHQAFASCLSELQTSYLNLNISNVLSSFSNFHLARYGDYNAQVKKAKELRKYSIAKKILDIKKDYTLPIKEFKCKQKRQQKFYNEIVLPLVKRFARQWTIEKHSIGECYAHYGFKNDTKTPMFLRLEDSEYITPLSALGYEIYQITLSADLKEQIRKLQELKAINKLPDYLRSAINNENFIQDKVTLDYSSMYRTSEDKQDYEYRVEPGILSIGKQLILRDFLIDMHYSVAFSLQKSNITHVKVGTESQPEKDEKKLKAVHETIVNRPPGSAVITTRGDISIENINLNLAELFDPKAFQTCNEDILDYFGLPIAFIPSKNAGVNNTVVVVGLKPFWQSIQTDRDVFQEFLNTYCEEINKRNGWTEIPQVLYKFTNLRDCTELIKELQFLKDGGVLSFEQLCLEFDYDYDQVEEQKKNDWKNRDWQAPTVELSQGTTPMLQKKFEQELELKSKSGSDDLNLSNDSQTNTE